jgi:hypothetical protein
MTSTADTLVPEQLWQAIQPLLPIPPRRYGDRLAGTRGPVPGRRDGVCATPGCLGPRRPAVRWTSGVMCGGWGS